MITTRLTYLATDRFGRQIWRSTDLSVSSTDLSVSSTGSTSAAKPARSGSYVGPDTDRTPRSGGSADRWHTRSQLCSRGTAAYVCDDDDSRASLEHAGAREPRHTQAGGAAQAPTCASGTKPPHIAGGVAPRSACRMTVRPAPAERAADEQAASWRGSERGGGESGLSTCLLSLVDSQRQICRHDRQICRRQI